MSASHAGVCTRRFNGAGDLHHRKDAGPLGIAVVFGHASTEPVIFITGKRSIRAAPPGQDDASTEPVIFITGKALGDSQLTLGDQLASTEPVIFITGKAHVAVREAHPEVASTEPVIFITGKEQERRRQLAIYARLQRSR